MQYIAHARAGAEPTPPRLPVTRAALQDGAAAICYDLWPEATRHAGQPGRGASHTGRGALSTHHPTGRSEALGALGQASRRYRLPQRSDRGDATRVLDGSSCRNASVLVASAVSEGHVRRRRSLPRARVPAPQAGGKPSGWASPQDAESRPGSREAPGAVSAGARTSSPRALSREREGADVTRPGTTLGHSEQLLNLILNRYSQC